VFAATPSHKTFDLGSASKHTLALEASVFLRTESGIRPVCSLQPGDLIFDYSGQLLEVLSTECQFEEAIGLGSGSTLFVTQDQLLLCNHFLCSALFGYTEVLLKAKDLEDCNIGCLHGNPKELISIRFSSEAIIEIGGWNLVSSSSGSIQLENQKKGRIAPGIQSNGAVPHKEAVMVPTSAIRPILTRTQTVILSGAEVVSRPQRRRPAV
jgi:hypothetical protein